MGGRSLRAEWAPRVWSLASPARLKREAETAPSAEAEGEAEAITVVAGAAAASGAAAEGEDLSYAEPAATGVAMSAGSGRATGRLS